MFIYDNLAQGLDLFFLLIIPSILITQIANPLSIITSVVGIIIPALYATRLLLADL
jgi:hypothetical protein